MSIDDIRARAEAATPGPWSVDDREQTVRAANAFIMFDRSSDHSDSWPSDKPDADFIAHARTDIPWLLDENTKLCDALLAIYDRCLAARGVGDRLSPIPIEQIIREALP